MSAHQLRREKEHNRWADMEVPSESFHRSSWDSRTCYPRRAFNQELTDDAGDWSGSCLLSHSITGPYTLCPFPRARWGERETRQKTGRPPWSLRRVVLWPLSSLSPRARETREEREGDNHHPSVSWRDYRRMDSCRLSLLSSQRKKGRNRVVSSWWFMSFLFLHTARRWETIN